MAWPPPVIAIRMPRPAILLGAEDRLRKWRAWCTGWARWHWRDRRARMIARVVPMARWVDRVVPARRAVAIIHAAGEGYCTQGRSQGNESISVHMTLRVDLTGAVWTPIVVGTLPARTQPDRWPSRNEKGRDSPAFWSVVGEAACSRAIDAIGRRRRRRSASAVERFAARTRRRAMAGVFAWPIPVARPAWAVPVAGAVSGTIPVAWPMARTIPVARSIPVVHAAGEDRHAQGRSQCGQSVSVHMKLHNETSLSGVWTLTIAVALRFQPKRAEFACKKARL